MTNHVVIYTDDPDKGGVANYNHELALGMVARGYRVTLIQSQSSSDATRKQAEVGIGHHWIGYDTGAEFVRTITDSKTASQALKACFPNLVIFSDCCAISNIAGKHAAIEAGIPFLTVVHNAAPYLAQRFASCLSVLKSQFSRAHQVISVSSENIRLLRKLFCLPEDKGLVIFPGAAAQYFEPTAPQRRVELRRQFGIPSDALVSLTSARLDPLKGFIFQICAMEHFQRQFPRSKLVCVWAGDGEAHTALSAEISQKRLGKYIKLIGRQHNVHEWLDASDLFTLTSLTEGMPISIMEAMAKSRVVVSTSVGGVVEELGGAGVVLSDPNTHPQDVVLGLIKAWAELERNPAKRRSLGAAARERAQKYFRIEEMIQRTVGEVESILCPANAS